MIFEGCASKNRTEIVAKRLQTQRSKQYSQQIVQKVDLGSFFDQIWTQKPSQITSKNDTEKIGKIGTKTEKVRLGKSDFGVWCEAHSEWNMSSTDLVS